MTDKPILFSGPMVRALLDGRKTQTRRVLSEQPEPFLPIGGADFVSQNGDGRWCWLNGHDGSIVHPFKVSYRPGDRLWVRETWNQFWFSQDGDDAWPGDEIVGPANIKEIADEAVRVSPPQIVYRESDRARKWFSDQKWRSPIFLPRWASRLTLIVTDVRVQRVQEISEEDAMAEGIKRNIPGWFPVPGIDGSGTTARAAFAMLWDSLNAKRGDGWDENLWVAAYTFTVHHQNIDQMEPGQ